MKMWRNHMEGYRKNTRKKSLVELREQCCFGLALVSLTWWFCLPFQQPGKTLFFSNECYSGNGCKIENLPKGKCKQCHLSTKIANFKKVPLLNLKSLHLCECRLARLSFLLLNEITSFIHFFHSFSKPAYLRGSRGQQLELERPSISFLCNKGKMLCWDAKTRPTKIYVISQSSSGTASRPSTNWCPTEQFFWQFFSGTFVSHVHTNAVAIFLVGEAAIRCLEIYKYLHF